MQAPEYLKGATNVYRTAKFIVRQVLVVQHDSEESGNIISYDDYYRRTPARDKQYEFLFSERRHVNGKRLPSNAYTRRYID